MRDEPREDVVDDLLYDPPHHARELSQRLGEVTREDVRTELLGRIETGELDDIDAIVAGNVFDVVGLGGERDRLVEIVSSPMPDAAEAHRRARQAAFVVLAMNTHFDPDSPEVTFGLTAERYTDLAASVYSSLLEFTEFNLELIYDFGEMLLQEPAEMRRGLFEQLEQYRHSSEVDAGVLYRPLIEEETYRELWSLLVEAIVEEGVVRDAVGLQRAADRADDEEEAQMFRKAAMELRSKGLGEQEAPEGFALLGTPDGSGAFPVFVFTERSRGGYTGHNAVFRHASHSVQDGFFIPDIVDDEIDNLVEEIETARATELTEVPVEIGLRVIRREIEAMERPFADLPPEARMALYRLERLPDAGARLPEIEPASQLDAEHVRRHFESDACFDSWFLDRSTLEKAGALPVPQPGEDTEGWKREAVARVSDLEGIAERVVTNLRLVARWYHLDDQPETARQFAALAERADEEFDESLAADLLLDHTITAIREMQDYAGAFLLELLGDETLRERIRDHHLDGESLGAADEERRLDYMELTYRTIDELRPELPEHVRPDFDVMIRAAGPIGTQMADFFEGSPIGPPDELAETVSEELFEAGVEDRVAGLFVPELLTNGRLLAMLSRN